MPSSGPRCEDDTMNYIRRSSMVPCIHRPALRNLLVSFVLTPCFLEVSMIWLDQQEDGYIKGCGSCPLAKKEAATGCRDSVCSHWGWLWAHLVGCHSVFGNDLRTMMVSSCSISTHSHVRVDICAFAPQTSMDSTGSMGVLRVVHFGQIDWAVYAWLLLCVGYISIRQLEEIGDGLFKELIINDIEGRVTDRVMEELVL